ncbi:hypothetical protein HYT56_03650 [Candidatus Woesearchaeota archaeon]|nr:hypothetical protein [Candidatus Woesearchaeota archaeon]
MIEKHGSIVDAETAEELFSNLEKMIGININLRMISYDVTDEGEVVFPENYSGMLIDVTDYSNGTPDLALNLDRYSEICFGNLNFMKGRRYGIARISKRKGRVIYLDPDADKEWQRLINESKRHK